MNDAIEYRAEPRDIRADCEGRFIPGAAFDGSEVVVQPRGLQAKFVAARGEPGDIQSRHRIDHVHVEVRVPAERLDDPKLCSNPGSAARRWTSQFPTDVIE